MSEKEHIGYMDKVECDACGKVCTCARYHKKDYHSDKVFMMNYCKTCKVFKKSK